jgi:hypothetical protein
MVAPISNFLIIIESDIIPPIRLFYYLHEKAVNYLYLMFSKKKTMRLDVRA